MTFGFAACTDAQSRPHFSRVSTRKLVMTTSAQRDQVAGELLARRAVRRSMRHRALVAGGHLPPQVHAALRRAHLAAGIAVARVLDVDHVGAEVGEQGAGQRAGDHVGELDDLEAGERTSPLGGGQGPKGERGWVGGGRAGESHAEMLIIRIVLVKRPRLDPEADDGGRQSERGADEEGRDEGPLRRRAFSMCARGQNGDGDLRAERRTDDACDGVDSGCLTGLAARHCIDDEVRHAGGRKADAAEEERRGDRDIHPAPEIQGDQDEPEGRRDPAD